MSRAAIYADINPNAIDGSSIWMMSITEVLSNIFDEIWVILKNEPTHHRLVQSVESIPNVILDFDSEKGPDYVRSIEESVDRAEEINAERGLDAVIVRGFDASLEFCKREELSNILWAYVTDLPFPTSKLSSTNRGRLERIAANSAGLFSQTEASRAYYESLAPSAPGKTFLLPPMIPNYAFRDISAEPYDLDPAEIKLVYAGKLAEDWKTLELVELPGELEKLGINATLFIAGEKINKGKNDPLFAPKMKTVLKAAKEGEYDGVVALGAISREDSISLIKSADIGIGWRTAELDSSLEVSTKALEYSAAGTPPVLNRNADHERLFGADYPLYISANATVRDLAILIAGNMDRLKDAREMSSQAAAPYSMGVAVDRLRDVFLRSQVIRLNEAGETEAQGEKTKVVVASHDLKFAGELLELLQKDSSFEIKFDHWETLHKNDEKTSLELADWADTIFCEFAGPNLEFYSKHARPETKLVTRLHGFEVRNRAPWFEKVDLEKVDEVITVSDHYARMTTEFLPELGDRVSTVSNMVDTLDFNRPKNNGAQFHIGLVGMVPFLKRPDRALELLQRLLESDDRYMLHFKGRMPWDYPYVWKSNIQRYQYLDLFRTIFSNEDLKEHIIFDPFSTDVASWLRGIGFVLSPSDNESFHLAPAEGMASGSIPIVWARDGATSVFGEHHVYSSIDQMVGQIQALNSDHDFSQASDSVKAEARKWDAREVYEDWREKLTNPRIGSELG